MDPKAIGIQIQKAYPQYANTDPSVLGSKYLSKYGGAISAVQTGKMKLSDIPEAQRIGVSLGLTPEQVSATEKTADQIKQETAKKNSERIINQLEDSYFKKKNDPRDDMSYGRLGGLWQNFLAKIGYNPDLRAYQALVESDRPSLARAAGDVGNLSETEQKAAIKILPNEFSTPEEAKKQFKLLKEKFGIDLMPKTETKSKNKFTIEAIE